MRMAVVFDFDGTLAPDSTTGFLRHVGVDTARFWGDGVESKVSAGWDPVPAYLYEIWRLSRAAEAPRAIGRDAFRRFGRDMRFFPGATGLFARLEQRLRARGGLLGLEYYLISSGIGEILRATTISGRFVRIWASDFHYDADGRLEFPRNIVSFTDKTRYLFELSKGVHGKGGPEQPFAVNRKVPPDRLRIPLERVIFVGDGYTDVPCFHLVRKNGGVAIGVFEEGKETEPQALGLLQDDRVSDLVPADYRAGSDLSRLLERAVDDIARRAERGAGPSGPPLPD
jgi:phosphoserine phosphatase